MLKWLLSWEVTSVSVGLLVGIGLAVLGMNDFKLARACFLLAAAHAIAGMAMWGFFTPLDSKVRIVAMGLCFGIIGILTVESWRYVERKGEVKSPPETAQTVDQEVTLQFEHTALFIASNKSSPFVPNRPVSLRIVYRNVSDATARRVKADGVMSFIEYGPGIQDREEQEWQKFEKAWRTIENALPLDLDGHKEEHFDINTNLISEQQAAALQGETLILYFFGAVRWTDGTGEYETTFCSYFRPSVKLFPNKPATWCDCSSGHNAVRRPFHKDVPPPPPPPRMIASVNIEVLPVIDLGARLAYYIVHMTNVGTLPARNLNRIVVPNVFRSGISNVAIDQEFIKFEQYAREHGRFGENTLGIRQAGEDKVKIIGMSFQDMLDVQAGTKSLYIFTIVKYKDDNHPEGLESKSCISYSRGLINSCEGHNEVP